MWPQSERYQHLSSSDVDDREQLELDQRIEGPKSVPSELVRAPLVLRRMSIWVVHLVLLTTSLVILFFASRNAGRQFVGNLVRDSIWSPALPEVGIRSEVMKFNGSFDFPSIYRGQPNAEVDAAWKRITKVGPFSITREDVVKMEKSAEACVQLPENLGGGYMGTMEVFHQLHCLDIIRKYTYLDYYQPQNPSFWGDPLIRMHVDHCIEMLRQNLMCASDLNIITYNFVEFRPEAWPDFNTVHRCRNFEHVLDWYHEREIYTTRNGNTQITKTAGAFIVPTPP